MKLSVVSTLYQSAPYVEEFHRRASAAAQQLVGQDYEIILVNDGSPDNSLEIAVTLTKVDPHLVVVDLSRNFGHHKALMTGLSYAQGDRVFLIDSDLEEEPEWLIPFAAQMDQEACDVVYGVQKKRKGNLFERWSGEVFFPLFRLLTGVQQPNNVVTARLMSRRYVKSLLLHQEHELNIGGLWIVTGFHQSQQIVYKHGGSPTNYSFVKKLNMFVNAIASFSSLPLVFTFYMGLIIAASAVGYIVYLVGQYFFLDYPVGGYTSLIVSLWFFSGLIILFLGVQGIYLSKIFLEVKNRPYIIVRDVYGRPASQRNV